LPVEKLFMIAAIPFAIGAVACFWLTQLYSRRFKGSGLGQRETLDAAAATRA